MNKHRRLITVLGLATIVAAASSCASYGGIKPGVSTMSDVRSASGKPTDVRFAPSGEQIWEYATGPQGDRTYVVQFDRNGLVSSAAQVLTEDNIERIVPGKTTDKDVRSLLGRPGDINALGDGEVWEWRFKPEGFAPETLYVFFGRDGVVTRVTQVQDLVGGDRRGRR